MKTLKVLAHLLWLLPAILQAAPSRPNLIFLLADDQTTYSMGCYGNTDVSTPNMDRLAAAGMVFDNHYNTTAICMASRASILTGLYEYRHGCNFEHGNLQMDFWARSYPVLLKRAGYRTAFAGKIGIEVTGQPDGKGELPSWDFDVWGAGPGQTSYATAKNASMKSYAREFPHSTLSYGAFGRDFIRSSSKEDRPFCLSISFKAPHMPATPDPRFDEVYRGKTFLKPRNYGREYGEHFSEQSRKGRQYERFVSWNYDKDYDGVMRLYHQQVHGIDVALGMILEALRETGTADNTIIVYTSDNGFLCGSHGYGSKVLPYEESSRAPLILLDPRHANSGKGIRCQALTGNVDILPTLLEFAGVQVPEDLDGRSLVPLYSNPEATIHESLSLMNVWGPVAVHSLAVITKDWKYIYWPYDKEGMTPAEELYETRQDPLELVNLAPHPEETASLRKMRDLYDQAVSQWRHRSVAFHRYPSYPDFFARR